MAKGRAGGSGGEAEPLGLVPPLAPGHPAPDAPVSTVLSSRLPSGATLPAAPAGQEPKHHAGSGSPSALLGSPLSSVPTGHPPAPPGTPQKPEGLSVPVRPPMSSVTPKPTAWTLLAQSLAPSALAPSAPPLCCRLLTAAPGRPPASTRLPLLSLSQLPSRSFCQLSLAFWAPPGQYRGKGHTALWGPSVALGPLPGAEEAPGGFPEPLFSLAQAFRERPRVLPQGPSLWELTGVSADRSLPDWGGGEGLDLAAPDHLR